MIETLNHVKKNGHGILKEAQGRYSEAKKAYDHFRRSFSKTVLEGTKQVKSRALTVNRKIRKNPFAYLGGAALAGLALGFIWGRDSKKEAWER